MPDKVVRHATAAADRERQENCDVKNRWFHDAMVLPNERPSSSDRRGQRASAEGEDFVKPVTHQTETPSAGSLQRPGQANLPSVSEPPIKYGPRDLTEEATRSYNNSQDRPAL